MAIRNNYSWKLRVRQKYVVFVFAFIDTQRTNKVSFEICIPMRGIDIHLNTHFMNTFCTPPISNFLCNLLFNGKQNISTCANAFKHLYGVFGNYEILVSGFITFRLL